MRRLSVWLFLPLAGVSAQNRLDIRKPSPPPIAVKGMPYSGEMVSKAMHVLDDGTRITQISVLRTEYRDSQGRTRREQVIPPDTKDALRWVTIDDPAATVEYVLEPRKKVAHRFMLKEPETKPQLSLGPPEDSPFGIKTMFEPLEPRTIQGLRAQGVRKTEMFPDTSALGNRGPMTRVTETWTAIDLQTVMEENISNTPGGETDAEMANLHLEEQPESRFQVPPDYRIEDELEDFIIEYPFRGRTSPPEVISRVQAKYTQTAGSLGIQGTVMLAATIDESGKARDVHVEESVDPGLDQEAIKAVSRWRFRPGRQDGHAVRVDVKFEVTFGIN